MSPKVTMPDEVSAISAGMNGDGAKPAADRRGVAAAIKPSLFAVVMRRSASSTTGRRQDDHAVAASSDAHATLICCSDHEGTFKAPLSDAILRST